LKAPWSPPSPSARIYTQSGESPAAHRLFDEDWASIIAVLMDMKLHSSVPVSIYVAVARAISGVSALLARETKGVELSETR
jgi:hypothetical protein